MSRSVSPSDWTSWPGAEPPRPRSLSVNTGTLQRRKPSPVSSWDIYQDFSLGLSSLAHLQLGDGVTEVLFSPASAH